jgi:hypothetical protein
MLYPKISARRIVGVFIAACGFFCSSLAVGMSGASAIPVGIPPQDPPPGDEAATSLTVRMKERCVWYVDGVPSEISLQPAGDDIGTVYDGSEYSLAVDLAELRAWNSGDESGGGVEYIDEHAWCTYFGVTSGIGISGEWSGGGFTATAAEGGRDENLDFDISPTNPLAMSLTKGTCRTPSQGAGASAWVLGGGSVEEVAGGSSGEYRLTKSESTGVLGGTLMAQPRGDTTDKPANRPMSNDRCGINWSVRVNIPNGKTPRYAGEVYTFSGPTFTTEIVIDSGGE